MATKDKNENLPPALENFNSLDKAIQAKIKYYKQVAEEQGDK
jgi:hypothetical protein